jgi:Histidine kinase-, DNA gyrase B-, and HSP90-like ATPase
VPTARPASDTADANPSKSFFISMLTRDINLADCMLDLLDNSVDGASKSNGATRKSSAGVRPYAGKTVKLSFDQNHFTIEDNSGGITIEAAKHYAFRFGRPDEAPDLKAGSIGLYGIGMKRAMFKMGNVVHLTTSTGSESFELRLNVDKWRRDDQNKDWTFELKKVARSGTTVPMGTKITISELYPSVAREFKNPHFVSSLIRSVSRDYAFILSQGLQVELNGKKLSETLPTIRESDDFVAFRHRDKLDGVSIEITAGFADSPPDDTSATGKYPEVEAYGWYVVCNDRVVVTADKSSLTGWGQDPVPTWHPQFGGFMGVVRFDANDPRKLPWKTTKRDVETSSAVYQHALTMMREATKKFTDYTNKRRAESKKAKRLEKRAKAAPVTRLTKDSQFKFPEFDGDTVAIEYVKDRREVEDAAEALKLRGASPSEVGIRTFDYFFEREVRK